jgi:ribosome-associated protein
MIKPVTRPATRTTPLPEAVQQVVNAALDKKAQHVVVLNLLGSGAFTDYFVLCSGQTGRQVLAIVDEIAKQLREQGTRPSHVEGYDHGEWVLLDCFDFVVHVFTEDTRRFYNLDRLWGSAARVEFSNPPRAR